MLPIPPRASFIAGFVLAALLESPLIAPARAAEAYLCDNNRLVYVEVADLERMIRSDPCIARYHGVDRDGSAADGKLVRLTGLKAPLGAPPAAASIVASAGPAAAASSPPAAAASTSAAISPLRTTLPARAVANRKRAAVAPREPLPPLQAAPGTDFRNVRVINAADEAGRWFSLAR